MLTFNKFILALAFLGGSTAAQAAGSNAEVSRIDHSRSNKKLTGTISASTARLSDATLAMSGAYASGSSSVSPSLTQGADNYLPVHHRL